MKTTGILGRFILMKPLLRQFLFDLPVLVVTGILGEVFGLMKMPFRPYSNIAGGIILAGAWLFHQYCHRGHNQAHRRAEQIDTVVTKGVFAKIRHPMYLSMIVMYLGLVIAWGVLLMCIPFVIVLVLTVLTVIGEEKFLLGKFPHEYGQYMKNVRWRLIPGIF
ncbi:MAG: isoprenylcysteine carboxylmethyltransferase family protein [Spirochaetales bacterium]|nr:isoprenylcysteine carboxylmethyltransferase family protein [Spirochaetales bacterium]